MSGRRAGIGENSERFDKLLGVAGDKQLLVGLDDEGLDAGVGSGDVVLLAVVFDVELLVDLDAEVVHVLADLAAQMQGVFADAAGEGDGVNAVHRRGIGADVLLDLIAERVSGERGAVIAGKREIDDVAGVGGLAGKADEAALFVEQVVHLGRGETLFVHNIGDDGGVDAAGAGAHDDAVERGEAHGGVDGLALVNSGDGGAVAEVAGDDLSSSIGRPISSATRALTKRWLVPWKP